MWRAYDELRLRSEAQHLEARKVGVLNRFEPGDMVDSHVEVRPL